MYETSFKFRSRPFSPTPQAATYFPAAAIERARTTAARLIERGEGPGLITGPPGTGKSLVCQVLAEAFKDRFSVVLLSSGRLKSCRAMLQTISYELDLPYRDLNEGDLRLSLLDFLEPKVGGNEGLLLVVDEAHTLPWRLLDEIRLMTNLVRDGQPRVRVIMAGASVLEERFNTPKLNSFSQRLAGRCFLEALERRETADYVRAQIAHAGGDPAQLVDDATLDSVYRVTEGVPRLINQVCDHALILASLGGHRRLSSDAIEEAWADLQQLPTAWTAPSESQVAANHIVEFGSLSDACDEAPNAIPFRGVTKQTLSVPMTARTPDDQIAAIADQLSTIEEEDEPQMVSLSENVLDFPEFGDPFEETFAEEEVIIDPYGNDVEIFADVPRVSTWESRQISSLLGQAEAAQPWLKNAPRTETKPTEQTTARSTGVDPWWNEPGLRRAEPIVPRSEVAPSQSVTIAAFEPASDPVLPVEVESVASDRQPPQPAPLERLTGVSNDRDLIVLEDDAPTPSPAAEPAATNAARKVEFRQLFAKLRRG